MKVRRVSANNRRRAFEVNAGKRTLFFPYAVSRPTPSVRDKVVSVAVDPELGNEGFTYVLESGGEGTVHVDHVLEYNKDPGYLADMLLYKLTLDAQRELEKSPLSTRELIRRLGTSPAQFYRLLDPTYYKKSIRQMLSLLYLLDREVQVVIKKRKIA
jgi:hypothetical protein